MPTHIVLDALRLMRKATTGYGVYCSPPHAHSPRPHHLTCIGSTCENAGSGPCFFDACVPLPQIYMDGNLPGRWYSTHC